MDSPPPCPPVPVKSPSESPNKASIKRKLSTSSASDCASCGSESKAPISCTGCYNYFCDSCINLPERKCLKCQTKAAHGSPPKCPVHDQELKFFCLTCERETCAECILDVTDHKRHTFDRMDAVYLEKLAVTNEKIADIGRQIETLEKHTEDAGKNLALIKDTEDNILAQLQVLYDTAKSEVNDVVQEKREELEKRIKLPSERKTSVKQLQSEIEAIGHFNFIKQQDRFNAECDKIRKQCEEFSTDFIDHYDIGCEMIPATKLTTYNIDWIDEKPELLTKTLDDSTGDSWKLTVVKGDLLLLTVAPNENVPLITSHKFKVTTEISHNDMSKSLRKRFVIQRKLMHLELATIDQLKSEGYLENDCLTFHIAIEPLNVMEAHDHYKDKAILLQKALIHCKHLLNASKESCESLKKDTESLKNFSVGYYLLEYSSIQKQSKSGFSSPNIVDFNGNEWKMEIKFDRDESNKILLSAYIFPAHIVTTSERSRHCAYFIELLHSNPTEIIRGFAENTFDESGLGRGWKGFVERLRVLNDVGFVRNGKICFRYGVRPSA